MCTAWDFRVWAWVRVAEASLEAPELILHSLKSGGNHGQVGVVYQGFQACNPRVVPLGFRILVRDPRRLHWVIFRLFYGRIVKTC